MFKGLRKKIFFLAFIQSLFLQLGFAQVTDTSLTVDSIHISGNRKTKAQIILRELSFKKGDTIHNWSYHQVQSRKQLINLFLFNEIVLRKVGNTIYIDVKERWYIWPKPKLEYADRNFNQWWLSKDPTRLIYGLNLEWYNLFGRNQTLALSLINGYTKMASVNYKVPYFNKKQTWGLQFTAQYSSNKEIWYKTANDKVQFFRDQDREMIRRSGAEISFTHRPKIFSYLNFYGGFRHWQVADTVSDAFVNRNYLLYGDNKQTEVYAGALFTYDHRDFKGFPLHGDLLKVNAEIANFPLPQFRGLQTFLFKIAYSKYIPITGNWFASVHVSARHYSNYYPQYSKIQALGYGKDYIRGYELNVIDGSEFLLGKAEVKYRFLNRKYKFLPKVKNYEQLPIALFLSTYFDLGYVLNNGITNYGSTDQNVLPNSWQNGKGLGLNVLAFYDYCMRLEYSFDKYMNNRFYVSFVASM